MTDQEWLLEKLARWRDTGRERAEVRDMVRSAEHQRLASRIRKALNGAPGRPFDWPLPPPC